MTRTPGNDPAARGAVLITGSGSGIGAATAVRAALAGYQVVASVHSLARVGDLRARMEAAGVDLDIRELDVTRAEAVAAAVSDVVADHGALHAVVSNAGITHMATFENEALESVRQVFEVNFFGPLALLKRAMPHLRTSRGRIIAIGSINGVVSAPFLESYTASKFALEGALESLAPVARRLGVAVSLVDPGPVSGTNVWRGHDLARFQTEAGEGYREIFAGLAANATEGRLTDVPAVQPVTEVADVVVRALASDDPDFRYTTSPAGHELLGRKLLDPTGNALVHRIGGWLDADLADAAPTPLPAG
ncbi:SDR family NAD(P)-dependent oxidoreductase [Frankia sp. Cpl3]|nr:SDR family NAD(P)-dependent oxidoreductase [Frankia sp. Cpl3]